MSTLLYHGNECLTEKPIFSLSISHPDDIPHLDLGGNSHFVTCLAAKWTRFSDSEILTLSTNLLVQGCTYFCFWGPGCERAHDLADSAEYLFRPDGPWSITTWHAKAPLHDALWFAINTAWPDPAFEDFTHSVLAISIGSSKLYSMICNDLSNLQKFNNNLGYPVGSISARVMMWYDYFCI